jgi:hypothetical protein
VAPVEKARRLDDRPVAFAGIAERREGHGANLALGTRLGRVREDPEDPGLQRGAPLEAVDPLHDPQPRLLHDLLGDGRVPDVHHREPKQRGVVALDENGERALVAVAQPLHDAQLVGRAYGLAHRVTSSTLTRSSPKSRSRLRRP